MPARRDGVELVSAAAAALRDEGIAVSDLALRRPTLDDVFLELTGNPPSEDGALPPVTATAAKTPRMPSGRPTGWIRLTHPDPLAFRRAAGDTLVVTRRTLRPFIRQ